MRDLLKIRRFFSREHVMNFSNFAAVLIIATGALVLVGWIFDIAVLKNVFPEFVSMKVNSALGYILAGFSLLLLGFTNKSSMARLISQTCAMAVTLLGLINVFQHILNKDFGIDQLFIPESADAVGTQFLGRMSPVTAIDFLMLGCALLMSGFRRTIRCSQIIAIPIGLTGLLTLASYMYGAASFVELNLHANMSIYSAVIYIVISFGVFLRHPSEGLARMVTGDTLGGWIFRRISILTVIVTLVFGGVLESLERRNYLDSSFGTAILVVTLMVTVVCVIWRIALELNRINDFRIHAENTLQEKDKSYRNQFVNSSFAMLLVNPEDGSIIEANSTVVNFYGYPYERLITMNMRDINILPEQDIRQAIFPIQEGQGKRFEFQHRLADGSLRDVSCSISSIQFSGRNVNHVIINDITNRKLAEEALKESENKYRQLIENSASAIASHEMVFNEDGWPVDYIFLSVNSAFEAQTGLRVADVLGRRVTEVLPNFEKSPFLEIYGKVVLTGEPACFDMYSEQLNRHYFVNAYHMGDKRFAAVFTDITDLKRAEDNLREREAFLGQLLNSIPIPVFYKDKKGIYLRANKAFESIFGKSKEQIIGKTVFDVSPPEIAEIYYAKDVELFNNPGTQVYPTKLQDALGVLHDVVFHKATITDTRGEVIGLIGAALDVTEQNKAEDALREREAFLKLLLETIPMPVYYKDRNGLYVLVNKAYETLYWKSKEQIIGKSVFDINPPNIAKNIHAEDLKLYDKPGVRAYYSQIEDSLGVMHDVICQKSSLMDKQGAVVGIIGAVLDITDSKRTEEELSDVRRQLEEAAVRANKKGGSVKTMI